MVRESGDSPRRIDIDLSVFEAGSGEPLLLVHGFPLDHAMWGFQLEELAQDFHVIAPDLPGFGASEAIDPDVEGGVSIRNYAEILADLLDELNVDQPVNFCGLSMGGYIGWQFLDQFPQRVAKLIACNTRAIADDEVTARGRRTMANQILSNDAASIADGLAEKMCGQTTRESRPDVMDFVVDTVSQTDPRAIAVAQRAMADRPDMTDWLSDVVVPSLFIVGQEDTISPPVEMRAMAAKVAGSRFVEIPYAGHLSPLENPDAFNAALRAFLAVEA